MTPITPGDATASRLSRRGRRAGQRVRVRPGGQAASSTASCRRRSWPVRSGSGTRTAAHASSTTPVLHDRVRPQPPAGAGPLEQGGGQLVGARRVPTHLLGRSEGAGQVDGERVHVGVDHPGQEAGERGPVVRLGEGGLGLGDVPAQPVVAELAQQVLLARVAPVQGADADARALGDGGDRRLRVVEEDRAGGFEDDLVVAGGLGAAAGQRLPGGVGMTPDYQWNGSFRSATAIAERNIPFRRSFSMTGTAIRPFRVEIPQAALDDLPARLGRTLGPPTCPAPATRTACSNDRVRALADRWRDGFDWRAVEARLNAHPQFITEIDGEQIHFLHVRSARPDATPLVLTHGWPGSVLEFLDVIAPLTEPTDPDAPAFHVVIPSLPGFGFSGPTRAPGWNRFRIARAWVELMDRLGYDRYGAVGNDGGSMIAPELGRLDPERVLGVHVTQLFSFPSGDPAEFAGLTEEDQAALGAPPVVLREHGLLQPGAQPAAADPGARAGRLAGRAARLERPALRREPRRRLHPGQRRALLVHRHRRLGDPLLLRGRARRAPPTEPTTAPTALAMFAGDFQSIRRFAERDHANIVRWTRVRRPTSTAAATSAATTPPTRPPRCWSPTSASSSPASADHGVSGCPRRTRRGHRRVRPRCWRGRPRRLAWPPPAPARPALGARRGRPAPARPALGARGGRSTRLSGSRGVPPRRIPRLQ